MKYFKNLYLIAGFLVLSSVSCKKFLTVTPKTQMPQDVLFNSEGGFKDALTGVYIQMINGSAYGRAMTMTTLEYLVSSWDVTANSVEQRLGLFNYADEGVQSNLSAIFKQQYKIIAGVNAILSNIDKERSVFITEGLYEMIKSECLAIRAYCHLDILRLFGPIPTNPAEGNQLAYVKELSRTPNEHISFEEFKSNLFQDLLEAETLSKKVDPILEFSLVDLRNIGPTRPFDPADSYMAYRYLRLNYYAIKALEARSYLWFGDNENAFKCAKEVIESKDRNGDSEFRLGVSSDFSGGNYILTNEQIFGLYDFDMVNKYTDLFGSGVLKKGSSASSINTTLYGNSGTDIRESELWSLITLSNQARCYIINKYEMPKEISAGIHDPRQIPMLRLSEMYLIAAETSPGSEGQKYWDDFKEARNLEATPLPVEQGQKQLRILVH